MDQNPQSEDKKPSLDARMGEAPGRESFSDPKMQRIHAQLLREKGEPKERETPMPVFILFLFAVVIFYCGIYIGKYAGGFRWDVYDPNFDPADMAQDRAPPEFDPIAAGGRIYRSRCLQCHQGNGQGIPGQYPPLVGTRWVTGSEERLVHILLNGLMGEIEVLGNTYNDNMPHFRNLSDRDIAAVLTFIRQEWGNDAPPVEQETVAEIRAEVGTRNPWQGAELLERFPLDQ